MAIYPGSDLHRDYNGELRRPANWQPPDQQQVHYRPPALGQSMGYGRVTASGVAEPDKLDPRLYPPPAGRHRVRKTKKSSRKSKKSRRKSRRNRRRVKRKTRNRR